MVGYRLDALDLFGILKGKIFIDLPQSRDKVFVKPFKLRQWQFTKSNKILYLDQYTVAYQSKLRKEFRKAFGLASIPAVDRRNGCK